MTFEATSAKSNNNNVSIKHINHSSDTDHVPELVIGLRSQISPTKHKFLRALIDSGASRSILHAASLPNALKSKIIDDPDGSITWSTNGGTYQTSYIAKFWFELSELAPAQYFKHTFKVDTTTNSPKYDIIIGRDLIKTLQIDLLWSSTVPSIGFAGKHIEMKPHGYWTRHRLRDFHNSQKIQQTTSKFTTIRESVLASISLSNINSIKSYGRDKLPLKNSHHGQIVNNYKHRSPTTRYYQRSTRFSNTQCYDTDNGPTFNSVNGTTFCSLGHNHSACPQKSCLVSSVSLKQSN